MTQRKTLSSTLERRGDALIVTVSGRLDSSSADAFGKTLVDALTADVRKLVIDMNTLAYISSAGLRVILIAGKRVHALEGVLVLVGLHGNVHHVFETCGFMILFDTAPSIEAALAA